jgi:hypothetical protein
MGAVVGNQSVPLITLPIPISILKSSCPFVLPNLSYGYQRELSMECPGALPSFGAGDNTYDHPLLPGCVESLR